MLEESMETPRAIFGGILSGTPEYTQNNLERNFVANPGKTFDRILEETPTVISAGFLMKLLEECCMKFSRKS